MTIATERHGNLKLVPSSLHPPYHILLDEKGEGLRQEVTNGNEG